MKSAADVAGVTAFAKTPTEAVNSGEVTEVAVKSDAWRARVEGYVDSNCWIKDRAEDQGLW